MQKLSHIALIFFLLFLPVSGFSSKPWGSEAITVRDTNLEDFPGEVKSSKLIPDGELLWILWLDDRSDPGRWGGRLYAQLINHHGNLLFPEGILLEEMGWCPDQAAFGAVPDGEGGIFVCSTNEDAIGAPKMIQHYDPGLNSLWDEALSIENLLYPQYLQPGEQGGMLLFAGAAEPIMVLVIVGNQGEMEVESVFNAEEARTAFPVGLVKRRNGYMAIGQIVWSANTSELRRLSLSSTGEPQMMADGLTFYQGPVMNPKIWELADKTSLMLYNGLNLNLYGQYFAASGNPTWGFFEGFELIPEPVSEFAPCIMGDGFWLQYRRNNQNPVQECLQRFLSNGEPQMETRVITQPPESHHIVNPVMDGGNGLFTITHQDDEFQPVIMQYDTNVNPRDGYELPFLLDNTDKPARAIASTQIWTDLVVSYVQDRHDTGNEGLFLQRFINAIPNTVKENPEFLPGKLEILSCYPEPFNSRTTIRMQVQALSLLNFSVYNMLGQAVIQNQFTPLNNGVISQSLDLNNLTSGSYFIKATQGENSIVRRITLLK